MQEKELQVIAREYLKMLNYGTIISEDDQALLLSFKLVPTVLTTNVKASVPATKIEVGKDKVHYNPLRPKVLNLTFAPS